MKVIHVLRKPLSEKTVAANTIKHGTGSLNIDACRVAAPGETIANHSRGDESAISKGIYGDSKGQPTHQTEGQKLGRWPANVILQHLDGCRCKGVKRVTTKVQHHSYKRSGEGFIGSIKSQPEKAHWTNKETVADWVCEPGCPVARLDEQSGDADGGVSRFYLQVGGDEEP